MGDKMTGIKECGTKECGTNFWQITFDSQI